jgi:hypothetical protein
VAVTSALTIDFVSQLNDRGRPVLPPAQRARCVMTFDEFLFARPVVLPRTEVETSCSVAPSVVSGPPWPARSLAA